MNTKFQFLLFALTGFAAVFANTPFVSAQHGVSSMTMGLARAGLAINPEMYRIEEMVNYHRHAIAPPGDGEFVTMEWSRLRRLNKTIYQLALATPVENIGQAAPPLNLTLVIDCSGSMSGDRIANVKRSLLAFSEQLRADDLLSLVTYSSTAQRIMPGCSRQKVQELIRHVESLQAGGSTNLAGGLTLGLEENRRLFLREGTNRVILLTDGIANVGPTDPHAIAEAARPFFDAGVELSCIGLGSDLNQELLRQLSDQGRGSIHFVNDACDIEKTFVAEASSLLQSVARKVRLTIELPCPATAATVMGYQPEIRGQQIEIELENLNADATQVVLLELPKSTEAGVLKAKLSYLPTNGEPLCELTKTATTDLDDGESDIAKNYAIGLVARGIRTAAEQLQQEAENTARQTLDRSLKQARRLFPSNDDPDFQRVVDIAQRIVEEIGQ